MQRAVFCSAVAVQRTVFRMSIRKYFLLKTPKDSVDDKNKRALTAEKVTAVMIADSSNGSGRKRRSATVTYYEDVRSKFEKLALAAKNRKFSVR